MRVFDNHLLKMNNARHYRSFRLPKFFQSFNDLLWSSSLRVQVLHVLSRVRVLLDRTWVRVQQDRDSSPRTRVPISAPTKPQLPSHYCLSLMYNQCYLLFLMHICHPPPRTIHVVFSMEIKSILWMASHLTQIYNQSFANNIFDYI